MALRKTSYWLGMVCLCLGLLSLGGVQAAKAPVKPTPVAGWEVIIDQPDSPSTRVRLVTDAQGSFEFKAPVAGMYRMLVQVPVTYPAGQAVPNAGSQVQIRQAVRWGEKETFKAKVRRLYLVMAPTVSTGESSSEEEITNGRTAGRLVYAQQAGEMIRGQVLRAP